MVSMAVGLLIGYVLLSVMARADMRTDLSNPRIWIAGLIVGFLHASGVFFVLTALKMPNVNLAQMVPLFNTNTLVAFVLAVVIFAELPNKEDLLSCFLGAVFVVIEAILISR